MAVATTTLAIIAGASALVSAVGAIRQGKAQKAQADFQSKVAQQQATRERQKSAAAEEDFRRKSSRRIAASRAAAGASGIEAGTGTSLLVAEDFAREEELSALRIGQEGLVKGQRLEEGASLLRAKGREAQTAGFFRAGSSLLSGAGSLAGSFGGGGGGGGELTPFQSSNLAALSR